MTISKDKMIRNIIDSDIEIFINEIKNDKIRNIIRNYFRRIRVSFALYEHSNKIDYYIENELYMHLFHLLKNNRKYYNELIYLVLNSFSKEELFELYNKLLFENIVVPDDFFEETFYVMEGNNDIYQTEVDTTKEKLYVDNLQRILKVIPIEEIYNKDEIISHLIRMYKSVSTNVKRNKISQILMFLASKGFILPRGFYALVLNRQRIPQEMTKKILKYV